MRNLMRTPSGSYAEGLMRGLMRKCLEYNFCLEKRLMRSYALSGFAAKVLCAAWVLSFYQAKPYKNGECASTSYAGSYAEGLMRPYASYAEGRYAEGPCIRPTLGKTSYAVLCGSSLLQQKVLCVLCQFLLD